LGRKPAPVIASVTVVHMDTPHLYEIVIEGHLSGQWSDWFGGLTIQNEPTSHGFLKKEKKG